MKVKRSRSTLPKNIRIRLGVFETNSSSSHSLTLDTASLVEEPFSKSVLRSGKLSVELDNYGWEWFRYYKPENKIAYLLTDVLRGNADDFEENARAQLIAKVVKDHTGLEIVLEHSYGGIDHESVGASSDAFENEESLKHFIFGKDTYVETGNDNTPAGLFISTDRGREFYSRLTQDGLAKSQKDWPSIELSFSRGNLDESHDLGLPPELAREVKRTGVLLGFTVLTHGKKAMFDRGYSVYDFVNRAMRDLKMRHLSSMKSQEDFKPDKNVDFPRIKGYGLSVYLNPQLHERVQAHLQPALKDQASTQAMRAIDKAQKAAKAVSKASQDKPSASNSASVSTSESASESVRPSAKTSSRKRTLAP